MSAMQVDLVRFKGGPRQGQLAIAIYEDYYNLILDLYGGLLVEYYALDFLLDPWEWTPEMHAVTCWLNENPLEDAHPPDKFTESILTNVGKKISLTNSVIVGSNHPSPPTKRIHIVSASVAALLGFGIPFKRRGKE